MAIDRGLATVDDVQRILFFRDFRENTDNDAQRNCENLEYWSDGQQDQYSTTPALR